MTSISVCLLLKILIIQMCTVRGQHAKGSLAFVIDDTFSMTDDIAAVRDGAHAIFETVAHAKDSQIQNYVVVTFNDPAYKSQLRIATDKENILQQVLSQLKVSSGNADCPEYAMKGIELALQNSLPFSYMFVFTDATAKDYDQYERVKRVAQKKQSQIIFALTGDCQGARNTPGYRIYHELAEATSGQVFHIDRKELKDIISYVKETVTGRRNLIASTKFLPGRGHKFNFTIDSKTESITIAISGIYSDIDTIGPDGNKVQLDFIANTSETKIVKLIDPKPGMYFIEVGSDSNTTVVITGKSNTYFEHGFSQFTPTSISDTATRPAQDGQTFLSIKMIGEGVIPETVTILNMDGSIVQELPLNIINKKYQFYGTKQFNPPYTMFRIEVVGYDVNDRSPVIRRAQTSIERLPLLYDDEDEKVNTAPTLTIQGESKITVDYESPLQIMCKVHAYPKPTITWQVKETADSLSASVHKLDTSDYMSILKVEKSDKNCTYQCTAENSHGKVSGDVVVITKTYFDVIEIPQNETIEYETAGYITCKVDALPPASIVWYKDSKMISNGSNILISGDSSVITITQMQLDLVGNYKCEARNKFNTQQFNFYVNISGVEKPIIDKKVITMNVPRGKQAVILCRLLEGKPKPTIHWEYKDKQTNIFRELKEYTGDQIELMNVTTHDTGSYKCIAKNGVGSDDLTVELLVVYPPTIEPDHKKAMLVKCGETVSLMCSVDGIPRPNVTWYKNDTKIYDTAKTLISEDNSVRFTATLDDIGTYTCTASNIVDIAIKTVFLDIFVPVTIDNPGETTINRMVGSNITLPCTAHGYPEPKIQWIFYGSDFTEAPVNVRFINETSVIIPLVQMNQDGAYVCTASNVGGAVNLTYTVTVLVPPSIENNSTTNTFEAVVGDMALRIQCNATGRPKPKISWLKDESPITFGNNITKNRYVKDEDGTLVIKNINNWAIGTYVCSAENDFDKVSVAYVVNVDEYPTLNDNYEYTTPTIYIEVGLSADLECQVPHNDTEQLRWYYWHENAPKIAHGELRLHEVTKSNEGLYTCRVSGIHKSLSAHTNVKIVTAPVFLRERTDHILIKQLSTPLECEAFGDPQPKVIWHHNGTPIGSQGTVFTLRTGIQAGEYKCVVSNNFGGIKRTFNVIPEDCKLDTRLDFQKTNQPLMTSNEIQKWPPYNVTNGYMVIPNNVQIGLLCKKGFILINPNIKYIVATCIGEDKFNIKGHIIKYSDIKCNTVTQPVEYNTKRRCLGENYIKQVRFRVLDVFYPVYEFCRDEKNDITLYTIHRLQPGLTYLTRNISDNMKKHTTLPINILSDCKTATKLTNISSHWCFGLRQLVNYHDLHPNVPVTASHGNWNIIPHWSSCGSKNWDEVEERVRSLADSIGRDLKVTTGVADNSTMCMRDSNSQLRPIPLYMWKVVEDTYMSASLAIIQVNLPDLSPIEVTKYVICEDICSTTVWMSSTQWHEVTKGYIYCCSVANFEARFYEQKFGFEHRRILVDVNSYI